MLERIGAISIIVGMLVGFCSLGWLFCRFISNRFRKTEKKRLRTPIVVLGVSFVLATAPIVINSVLTQFRSLGPLNKIVSGERHLTLTGWDRHDYSVIADYPDAIVLQMANPDVTDETLQFVTSLKQIRELDLNNSQISDAGLSALAELPNLQDLRLARTKITDEGFRLHLLNNQTLMNLELTGTQVASKTIREWKAAKPDRRALH